MSKVGIFFGTDTGTTRKIAKQMQRALGDDVAAKPLNINRASASDLCSYDYLILGTPTLGEGQLPGMSADCQEESWEEKVPELEEADFSDIKVALFGLGDQVNYADEFVDGLGELYDLFSELGADLVGEWPSEGYTFNASTALLENDKFAGLVLDNDNQADLHEQRIAAWLEQLQAEMAW